MEMTEQQQAALSALEALQFGGDEHLGFTCTDAEGAQCTHSELCSYLWSARALVHTMRTDDEAQRREIGTLREQLASAREENSLLSDSHTKIATERSSYLSDLTVLARALYEEAVSREWCGEYDDFVRQTNRRTQGEWLEECTVTDERTFTVTVTYEGPRAEREEVIEDVVERLRHLNDHEHVSLRVERRPG